MPGAQCRGHHGNSCYCWWWWCYFFVFLLDPVIFSSLLAWHRNICLCLQQGNDNTFCSFKIKSILDLCNLASPSKIHLHGFLPSTGQRNLTYWRQKDVLAQHYIRYHRYLRGVRCKTCLQFSWPRAGIKLSEKAPHSATDLGEGDRLRF